MHRYPRSFLSLALGVVVLVGCDGASSEALSDAMGVATDSKAPADARAPCEGDGCPTRPVLLGSWGGRGTQPGQFIEPSSVELDSLGQVIVAGHENRIQRFTREGVLIDIFGVAGVDDGEFNHPHGLAVDRDRGDLLYVGDQENQRLQVFTPEGSFLRQWGDSKFQHIHDVGIDRATGDIFVGDLELHTVRKFSATGLLLGEFGGFGSSPGKFNEVWGISTDSSGFVYVADTKNKRVQKLTSAGEYVKEWSTYGGTEFIKPTGVYVDTDDTIYVCDSLAQVVALFDTEGTLLDVWDLQEIYGSRSEPEDIVIDTAGEHIYISEVFEHRVLHLKMP